jgi:hypothetical protein
MLVAVKLKEYGGGFRSLAVQSNSPGGRGCEMGLTRTFGTTSALFLSFVLVAAGGAQATDKRANRDLIIGDETRNLKFYAHLNRGALSYDDGRERSTYFVDNAHYETRFGAIGTVHINDDWTIIGAYEAQYDPYSSGYVNQINRGSVNWDDAYLLRKAELRIRNHHRGQLWLGQGSMASDSVSERDLSGTTLSGFSDARRLAGGQFFQFSGRMALSDIKVSNVFDNLDGLSRKLRVRYDTPRFYGISAASSVGTEVVPKRTNITVWDVMFDYKHTHGPYKMDGGVSFSQPASDRNRINGSFSTLHTPSGVSLTVAAGLEDKDSRTPQFIYGKIGHQTQHFEFGLTALSADMYVGRNFYTQGSDSFSVGFQSVQRLDRLRSELYLGARYFRYDDSDADYKSGVGILAGTRIKF